MIGIAGSFAFFQFLMPMIGWFCFHAAADSTDTDNKTADREDAVKEVADKEESDQEDAYSNRKGKLSIKALCCSLIILALTFVICMAGLLFGKLFGEKFAENAIIAGGIVLIGIGLEIFIKSFIS
ncbi:Putative Mn2+ efflux pump MntP [Lachnospiraceae bacterium XPB1003]|nr:Putative Mn2+ efflux pump MntP [Lachnospiraceae bacterium XPB1003]